MTSNVNFDIFINISLLAQIIFEKSQRRRGGERGEKSIVIMATTFCLYLPMAAHTLHSDQLHFFIE